MRTPTRAEPVGKPPHGADAVWLSRPEAHPALKKGGLEKLDDVQRYAFDEMNLVELPFALLTDAKDLGKQSPKEMPLGPGGEECLVAGGRGNLPTALAERVILSLLWLTQKTNRFKEPTVRFSLRRLIHEYMYPDRADNNRAGGAFYKRVEDELHRIAATRIITSRWYDRELKKLTQISSRFSVTVRFSG